MKKVLLTASMMAAVSPMIAEDVAFADNIENTSNIIEMRSTQKTGVVNLNSTTNLYIRASYSTNSAILGKVPGGKTINILGETSGWYKVEYNGITGYSSAQYIKANQSSSNTTVSSKEGRVVNVGSSRLNVRSGASTSYKTVGQLNSGDKVTITEKAGNWYKIKTSSLTGYAYADYIQEGSGSSSNTNGNINSVQSIQSSNIGKIATVTADSLNVRSGYGVEYSVVTKVSRGTDVKIIEVYSNGWSKVTLPTGVTGYVNHLYLNNYRTGSLNSQTGSNTSESTSTAKKVQEVINVAKSKLGCPYVWGAEGPNSFDCSGLTSYAFKKGAGITIPRTSKTQATAGYAVSRSNLKPGDLVFFNTSGSGISHVGLYIGNDEMIHSPKPGDVVKVVKITSNYYSTRYVTARRVIQ